MLGSYRYFLALLVTLSHMQVMSVWWQGSYAVFGFYVISGYLMTFVLREVYVGYSNVWRYLVNRFLRIFPLYWFLTILTILCLAAGMKIIYAEIPINPKTILANLTLIYYPKIVLTVTQAWSLRVELVFYVFMIFLCRDARIVWVWFLVSVFIVVYLNVTDTKFKFMNNTLYGSSIAFALGSLVYYCKDWLKPRKIHLFLSFFALIFHMYFAEIIWSFPSVGGGIQAGFYPHHFGIYANTVLATYFLLAIVCLNLTRGGDNWYGKLDKFLGDITYGIFLSHWVAIALARHLFSPDSSKWIQDIVALIITHIIAIVLFYYFETPINRKFRDRIRPVELK